MHNAILTDGVIREMNRYSESEREANYRRQREQAEWEEQAERDWQNQEAERMANDISDDDHHCDTNVF